MHQMKTIIAITLWVFFLTGCSGTHPFIPPVAGQPGYPGEQHDLFPCAAFRIAAPVSVDEISWDTNLGAFQNNVISTTYLPGQFGGTLLCGNQRDGWLMDDAGYAYFAHATLTNTIEVYQSTIGAYKLGTWALWAADGTQTWTNLDFSGYDDYIFGLAFESVSASLYAMWLDTNTPPLIFTTLPLVRTIGTSLYSCTRYGDYLFGPLHYIFQLTETRYYSFQEPPSSGAFPIEHLTPDVLPYEWDACQIVGDFEERLWVFYSGFVGGTGTMVAHNTLESTTWFDSANIPFAVGISDYAWKSATRYTDDTIHSVAIYVVADGPNWDYQLWYTRRFKSGWMTAEMIDNWSVVGLNKAFQDARLSAQITTSPSGIMLWTIQYDGVLSIGDVCAYFLGPANYHNPIQANWIPYIDADGTNYDYLELNAPKWWRI